MIETIVAPATATGGALAVVRMSGPRAMEIYGEVFRGTGRYGEIMDGDEVVDEVVAAIFRAPHSFTGEDVVEISCHGSRYVVGRIVELLQRHGARLAEPGEFSMRAFLAGKIDLSQAEAIADTIAADSRAELALAANQMRGAYSETLTAMREKLLKITSLIELELDFGEEEVSFANREELRAMMEDLAAQIEKLCHSFSLGNAIKRGVTVAIVGPPNAGKSTLLNRLVGEDRALVSDIAGTTRDTVEEMVDIDGVRFRFIDTAGLHDSSDALERLGMERSIDALRRAQIVLQLTPADEPMPAPIPVREDQTHIWVVNKTDLVPNSSEFPISAKTGSGIDKLLSHLRSLYDTRALYSGEPIVSNRRHAEALSHASEALTRALTALDDDTPSELLSEELRLVIHHLGTITGAITSDDVLHSIFSQFCIGK